MSTNWRPKGWENLYRTDEIRSDSSSAGIQQHTAHRAFEAGADAMHKADVEWLIEHGITSSWDTDITLAEWRKFADEEPDDR